MAETARIVRVNAESIRIKCKCEREFTVPFSEYITEFNEEFGSYFNFNCWCEECNNIFILNMNIPATKYHEFDMVPYMDQEEIRQRELIRQVIWKIRPDLAEMNREEVEAAEIKRLEEEYGASIEEIEIMLASDAEKLREQI